MDLRSAYLRDSTKLEPLLDRWPAWPHLLAPVQQALNLAYRYLPALNSFLAAPAVHQAAARDPKMYGTPFVDLPPSETDSVKKYLDKTEVDRSEALIFATHFRNLQLAVSNEVGYSLDAIRDSLEDVLRGRVDLVYDLNNRASVRILEQMLGYGDLGHRRSQEIKFRSDLERDRPFFLSTPRLFQFDGPVISCPFDSELNFQLYSAWRQPINLIEFAESTGQPVDALAKYFCELPQTSNHVRHTGPGVRVRYFGHACILIETESACVVIDPVIAQDAYTGLDHFDFSHLPEHIDAVFISHGHQDHFSPEMLMRLRDRVRVVIIPPNNSGEPSDPSLELMLRALGYRDIRTLSPFCAFDILDIRIVSLPFTGEHCDLNIHSKQCALIEAQGRRICVFADTDAIDMDVYRRLSPWLRSPNLMLLGMECFGAPLSWLYGPLLPHSISQRMDGSRRLSGANAARASTLTRELEPDQVAVYAMGQEPWMRPVMGLNYTESSVQLTQVRSFLNECAAMGVSAKHLYLKEEFLL